MKIIINIIHVWALPLVLSFIILNEPLIIGCVQIGLQLASYVTVYILITQVCIHYIHILCNNINMLYLSYKYSSVQVVIIRTRICYQADITNNI